VHTVHLRLAGRRREQQVVTDVLTGAAGVPALVVAGEPGIGKSALVTAVSDVVMSRRVVLTGWCLSLSEELPFLPLVDVLRALVERDEGRLFKATVAACPRYVPGEIGRLLPELVDDAPPELAGAESGDGWRRQRLFAAVRALLAALAESAPSAVVVEDVHWADRSTRDLIDYLLAPSHRTGVPLVLTARAEEPDSGWLPDLRRSGHVTWLPLRPLTSAETAEQIELLGGEPSPALVAGVFSRSQGNPFFTEQLLSVGAEPGGLPASLQAVLRERLSSVAGASRDVVTALGVARRPLDEVALCSLSGRSSGQLIKALQNLSGRRLVQRTVNREWQLSHVLLAEATCADLTAIELRDWHMRIAECIATQDDPALASEVAEHYAAAGLDVEELRWRVRAARHADVVYAPVEGAQHWQRVLALWDAIGRPETIADLDLVDVYFHASTALENAGDTAGAARVVDEALARLLADATPATKVRLYHWAGRWRRLASPQDGADLLENAIEIGANLTPTRDYIRALRTLAHAHRDQRGGYELQHELLTRSLRAAERAGIRHEQKVLIASLAWHAMTRDDKRQVLAEVDRALAIILDPEDPIVEASVAVYVIDILLKYGELAQAVEVGRAALEDAVDHGYPHAYASIVLLSNVSEALRELGRVSEALAVLAPVTREPVSQTSVIAYKELAALHCIQGRLDQAAAFWSDNDAVIRAFAGLDFPREFTLLRDELWLWQGRAADALTDALLVLEPLSTTEDSQLAGGLFVLALRAGADIAERARAAGDDDAVASALEQAARLKELLGRCVRDPFGGAGIPATRSADAATWRAEWSRLNGPNDPSRWNTAASAWALLSRPHRAGYALWRQAQAILETPQGRGAARPVLRSAATAANGHTPLSLGIANLAARARIELAETAIEPSAAGPDTEPFGLTDRELAVLRLLAEGKTNSEIGVTLLISRKTASVHVTNILRKLQVSSRVQAAAVAAHAHLLAPDHTDDT
jgi:DNA-binding CsgD family transcriptional regulator/tetratricopeptide (TPR) repeat protein